MKFRLKYIILSLIFIIAGVANTNAQVEKEAQSGFRFLSNPVSAEAMGRGATGVVNTFNSNAIFWNPALISFNERTVDVSLNYTKSIADINYSAGAASIQIGSFGVIGLSLLAMDYGTFYGTVRAANEQGYIETGTFSPSALAAGLTFSSKISDRFSYGVQFKYAHQDLKSAMVTISGDSLSDPNLSLAERRYKTDVYALDVGAFYDFRFKGIKFGAVLQNISEEVSYENEEFPLPFSISFGASIKPLTFLNDNETSNALQLNFESVHPRDFNEKVKIGAEYNYLNTFIIRAGYVFNYDERNWTAGLGLRQEISDFPLRVDYAFEPFGVLGNR
ncbi:MAG TPA: PorV/PorQ family protein, partial [Ignavibacteriaceae bacterium]